ncbi:MAG: ATP-dependent endonuclease, partial [Proteobacteria bacterium]
MSASFYKTLRQEFPFEPTTKQDIFFQMVADFATNINPDEIFMLKGYAGTGKTTVISALVNALPHINKKYVLLAPTGRAAKVISGYSGKLAQTIHRKIYFPKKGSGGGVMFTLMPNKHTNTIFIVDESSMISDTGSESKFYENGSLLDDLIEYVYLGKNCKLLLLGDTAQLPPVNSEISPALDIDHLARSYGMNIPHIEFDEVMRQAETSGILYNATQMRELLNDDFIPGFKFDVSGFKDIIRLTDGYD